MNPGPVLRMDRTGGILLANRAARDLFGPDRVVGRSWSELFPETDGASWGRLLEEGGTVQHETLQGRRSLVFTLAHRVGSGFVFAYGADVTQLKIAERVLAEQAAALAEMARFPEMNPGPVCRLDERGTVLLANRAARELFERENLIGSSWLELCPGIDEAFWARIRAESAETTHEAIIGGRHFLFTHRPVVGGADTFVYGADISGQKNAEHALRQSERMATLGTLAAGVAHELNNPAAAAQRASEQLRSAFAALQRAQADLGRGRAAEIPSEVLTELDVHARERASCACDMDPLVRSDREAALEDWLSEHGVEDPWDLAPGLVEMDYDPPALDRLAGRVHPDAVAPIVSWLARVYPVYRLLDEIRHGAGRVSEIVTALKAYSYVGQAPVQAVDVNEGIRSTLVILRNKLKQGITVEQELDPRLPRLQAWGSELNQVWTNLIDNAADAMGREGRLRIRSSFRDGWIEVEVEDDGPGVPSAIQSRIFDPFFTTKPPGKGTGLGLDTSWRIVVRRHGGSIRLDSKPGARSSRCASPSRGRPIRRPRPKDPRWTTRRPSPPNPTNGREETSKAVILTVDDEPQVLSHERDGVLSEARLLYPDARKVLLTAYADTSTAIAGINDVGLDYGPSVDAPRRPCPGSPRLRPAPASRARHPPALPLASARPRARRSRSARTYEPLTESRLLAVDRVTLVERALDLWLERASPTDRPLAPDAPIRPGSGLTARRAVELWEDQVTSRAVDVEARRLKASGRSFYTISGAGHEQNAVVGAQLRTTDPAFLHYRSGGFMMARARRARGPEAGEDGVGRAAVTDPVLDAMLSVCAKRDDPIAQGRHKVWGSRPLWVPPQTSTIASHLPKAVGMAFALGRARRLGIEGELPEDALVVCSFGDASANHATALSGINAARYGVRRGNPVPILFVCEDNGIGISVDTPPRWIRESFGGMRYLRYFEADGEVDEVWDTVEEAVHLCRERRLPVFLRLVTQRLWGHAGSDVETGYRSLSDIERVEADDPLLRNARRLVGTGAATPKELAAILADVRQRVRAAGEDAAGRAHLETAEEVVRPMAPWDEARVRASASVVVDPERRRAFWGEELPEEVKAPVKRTMAAHLSAALADEMLRRPEVIVFGEDVGRKGGVYYVTAGLQKRFGVARVLDTLLDETTILGMAQGAGMAGLLPVPEIQYLAYVHNAVDQLRGEAASLQYFSNGQFSNPMVVRLAGLAYQKGFGGHFHNDNAIGGLRDIPGLILATPSRGDDAVRMLRGCLATAAECGRVVVFLEPIALYHERDLHEEGDGLWLSDYPASGEALVPGDVSLHGEGDVLLVSYANGLRMSLQAQRILARDHGIACQVLDVRWLSPLPLEAVRRAAEGKRAVVVVDECRRTGGGIADAVVADLAEAGVQARLRSVRAVDSYVPLGPPANLVLVQTPQIVDGVREVVAAPGKVDRLKIL